MKHFEDIHYEPFEITSWEKQIKEAIEAFRKATSGEMAIEKMQAINALRSQFETARNLVDLRNAIDTEDGFYEEAKNMMDEWSPRVDQQVDVYYKALVASPFADHINKRFGPHLMNLAKQKLRTFSEGIMDKLAEENKLSTQYTKLRAKIKVHFQGAVYTLSQMGPFLEAKDHTLRTQAYQAYEQALMSEQEAFETLFDDLVHVRHGIARDLGYENFVALAYDRLQRTDYTPKEVAVFRESVLKDLVPKLLPLYQKQAKRLGLDHLQYHDLSLSFLSGNPAPKGDKAWILAGGLRMYSELSEETGVFFKTMLDRGLMDLDAKEGKAGGGFCTYLNDEKAPFIFSNFNGTAGDIDVLTHEAGHAFQVYQSMDQALVEYHWPTLEACEIHSMSMEFLTYPWMQVFFEEDVEKYKYSHLSNALQFIPYGVLVDHFQHWVYTHPEASKKDRNQMWRALEKQYCPERDYRAYPGLDQGTYWFRQGHIFKDPFYYIDYTLAQVCAFQFWLWSRRDADEALKAYIALCQLGGSMPFTQLVDQIGLKQPFSAQTMPEVVQEVMAYLETIDDTQF